MNGVEPVRLEPGNGGSHPPKVHRHTPARWWPALALVAGTFALGTPAQAGTVVISSGGLIVSTSDFFLSIGRPVVIHQPVIVSYPVYHFPHGSHYRIQTYHPHHRYRYPAYPPLVIDDRLEADGMSGVQNGPFPNRVTVQTLPAASGIVSSGSLVESPTSATTPVIQTFNTPIVLPDSAWPAALPLPTAAGNLPPGVTTEAIPERIISPSPFNSSLLELQ